MGVDVLDVFRVIDVGVVLDFLRLPFLMCYAIYLLLGNLLAVFRVDILCRYFGKRAGRRGKGRGRKRRRRQEQCQPHRRKPLEPFLQKIHFLIPPSQTYFQTDTAWINHAPSSTLEPPP